MSRRTAESNKAIRLAWERERNLIQQGKGTRDWTKKQQQDILDPDKGKAYDNRGRAFEGQHMKSVEKYPEYQGNPDNIQFLTKEEHLEAHQGNWRNSTNWYYNPETKEHVEFENNSFAACKVLKLSDPIVTDPVRRQGIFNDKAKMRSSQSNLKGENFSMAINEGTDFSEAAQEKAAAKYGEVIESIQTFSESVVTHFIERVKGHPYKQLEEAGNVFIRSYNEELPRKVKEAIRSWCQSENSFAASIARQYDDNEESKSAALNVEKGIEDKVDACFKDIDEIKINKPISVNAEAIISDAQYMEGLSKELKKEKEMWMGVFQKLGEQQNSLYSNMEELVAETFNKTEEEYQAVYKDIMNVSEEFKAARAAVIKSANTKASNVKDNIQNIVDQYTRRRKNKH